MATATKKKLEDPFLDESMKVPLCGEPGYAPRGAGEGFLDERFGGLDTSGSGQGSKDLKAFLLEQTASQEPATLLHVGNHEFRVYFKDGAWRGKGIVDGQLHRLSDSTRDGLIGKLMQFAKRDVIHDLTRSQEIEVARLCQAGQKSEGIARYLEYRLGPERAARYSNDFEMVNDPQLQGVMDECALYTWQCSRADVTDSQEWREFLAEYIGGRPLNHDLLDAAWVAFGPYQERRSREEAVARFAKPEAPAGPLEIQSAIEEMPDAEVEKIMAATKREYVRQVRAGAR